MSVVLLQMIAEDKQLFAKADKDGDGKLNEEEFLSFRSVILADLSECDISESIFGIEIFFQKAKFLLMKSY